HGDTLAHLLISLGSAYPLQVQNIDLTIKNHKGKAPLHFAAEQEDSNLLKQLLSVLEIEDRNPIDIDGKTPVFYAISTKREKNLSVLVEHRANLNHLDRSLVIPLIYACKN